MLFRNFSSLMFVLLAAILISGCAGTRQIAIDHPEFQTQPFYPLPGFHTIDGDDYYVRLISEFDFKGNNILKSGCTDITPSYEKSDLSAALVYNIRNDSLKFNGDAAGFLYQATTGKCNFKFDAKKLYLTPWMRLDTGKETMIDYSFYTNANSDLDVSGLVGDVNAASSLLSLTGVGMGVAIMGQVAGQWLNSDQQTPSTPPPSSIRHSSESHSLPALTSYSGKSGTLNQTVFKVFEVVEGGFNPFGSETRPLGELKVYPEILSTLLLKTSTGGIPDARDLSLEEIGYSPIKSSTGNINLQQLIEQSKHPAKPNLKPDWSNYGEVESNCRNLKLVMKDLGFNKFDRNALLYYYLSKSPDWKNYNITRQKALNDEIRPTAMKSFRSKDFGNCLAEDDYGVMKTMGLAVNTTADWDLIGTTSEKKEQLLTPLKSIERQLLAVLKNTNVAEMERQLYPLLTTLKNGDGTVLLQNHLGEFGLEKLLNSSSLPSTTIKTDTPSTEASTANATTTANEAPPVAHPPAVNQMGPDAPTAPLADKPPVNKAETPKVDSTAALPTVTAIPGEGLIINARQLAEVFAGISINELSCSRPIPAQQGKAIGNAGILLFTTKPGSPRNKGGAIEFEFASGKITRIAFQLPTYRDFEQDILDRPEIGGCRIDPSFLTKLNLP